MSSYGNDTYRGSVPPLEFHFFVRGLQLFKLTGYYISLHQGDHKVSRNISIIYEVTLSVN